MNEEKSSPLPLYGIPRHLPFEQSIQAGARVKTENDKGSLKPSFQLAKGRWYDRHRRHATCAVYLLFVLVLLASCSSQSFPSTATPTTLPTMVSTVTRGTIAPSAVKTMLAPAPQHCPSAPSAGSRVFSNGLGGFKGEVTATGSTPVWTPYAQPNMKLILNQLGYTSWPGTKFVWEVGPNYTQTVTVKVTNLRTGELAWWDTGEGAPPPTHITRTLVLDQHQPSYHGEPVPGWHEWGSFLYILQAGCYRMDVNWPGGRWQIFFAAGR